MQLPIHVIDAFTGHAFSGNPAGVVILDRFLPDALMLAIATEMKHAETAFVVPTETPPAPPNGSSDDQLGDVVAGTPDGPHFDLRWFTPTLEVDLCGHATLAAAHALFLTLGDLPGVTFHTRSGPLSCTREGHRYRLNFPSLPVTPATPVPELLPALGLSSARFIGRTPFDYLVEVDTPDLVTSLMPDFARLRRIETRGVTVTALSNPGSAYNIISRFFAPAVGVPEDPVTGSAHCALATYFAPRLGNEIVAFQASSRTGTVHTRLCGNRVELLGEAVRVLTGLLFLKDPA